MLQKCIEHETTEGLRRLIEHEKTRGWYPFGPAYIVDSVIGEHAYAQQMEYRHQKPGPSEIK